MSIRTEPGKKLINYLTVVVYVVDERPPVVVLGQDVGVADHHKEGLGAGHSNVEPGMGITIVAIECRHNLRIAVPLVEKTNVPVI